MEEVLASEVEGSLVQTLTQIRFQSFLATQDVAAQGRTDSLKRLERLQCFTVVVEEFKIFSPQGR